jgi:MFS transporter, PAT family, solute carrier family 33 (acetyl-CoA transportor), member 1
MPRLPNKVTAVSSSLDSIQVPPRTPYADDSPNGKEDEGIELSLLDDEERRAAATGDDDFGVGKVKQGVSAKDKRGMALLIVLCEPILQPSFLVIFAYERHRSNTGCSGTHV